MSDTGGGAPWWLALAIGIATTLVAAIGKLWTENNALRREAAERSEREQGDHKRDLRRMVWGPTDPPKPSDRLTFDDDDDRFRKR